MPKVNEADALVWIHNDIVQLQVAMPDLLKVLRAKEAAIELRELDVSRNNYDMAGALALSAVLPFARLHGITVGPREPTRFALRSEDIDHLDMKDEDLDEADTVVLASALSTYKGLENLNLLGGHKLGERGAEALVRVFHKEPQLLSLLGLSGDWDPNDDERKIDVSGQGVDASCLTLLARELEAGRTTRAANMIDLSENNFLQEVLTKGSNIMRIGENQCGVALCGPKNHDRPGLVHVRFDDNSEDWLKPSECSVIAETDAWKRLCRAMMPREQKAVKNHLGRTVTPEFPAYGADPTTSAESDFYQLRFGTRFFRPLPHKYYTRSPKFWKARNIKEKDPVVVQVVEAPADDLRAMLMTHVDHAQEELERIQQELYPDLSEKARDEKNPRLSVLRWQLKACTNSGAGRKQLASLLERIGEVSDYFALPPRQIEETKVWHIYGIFE